jgi:4-diphosphocytidyl-2-C-methyl-D-erythritol kinase
MSFSIQRADPAQLDELCAIERAAVQLFRGHAAWPSYAAMPVPPELLLQAIQRGLVWVASGILGAPVGFIWLDQGGNNDSIGIAEFGVLPDFGRRGIGTALLRHACDRAAAAGYRRIDLGTLADVAWNAPFYAKHGFAVVDKHDPSFAAALQRDRENGFPDRLRVFMSRSLRAPAHGEWTIWPAPAKLNLFLRIVGRRNDGYHELQTVFRLLDWGDEIRLRLRDDAEVRRLTEVPGVPPQGDLMVRAAKLLQQHAAVAGGVDIDIEKRIPMGGGLGGGSSDAATVLVALNLLWGLGLPEDVLAELGCQLGADVPLFVRGRSAWAEGIGDQLTPLALPRRHYVVLDPHAAVSTAALFQASELTRNAPRATISSFVSGETTENAFAPVARARYPQVAAALDWLGSFGQARLSGSGGCVFLETRSFDRAMAIAGRCPMAFTARVAAGVDGSSLQLALARHRDRH